MVLAAGDRRGFFYFLLWCLSCFVFWSGKMTLYRKIVIKQNRINLIHFGIVLFQIRRLVLYQQMVIGQ